MTRAHSIGTFSIFENTWDTMAIFRMILPTGVFPPVANQKIRGYLSNNGLCSAFKRHKIPVCIAIGDNQAAFKGSILDIKKTLLINAGT